MLNLVKDYLLDHFYQKHPVAEYAAVAVKSGADAEEVIALCNFPFSPNEKIKLYFQILVPAIVWVPLTGWLTTVFEPVAVSLHSAVGLPQWTLPFCIFYAGIRATAIFSECVSNINFEM